MQPKSLFTMRQKTRVYKTLRNSFITLFALGSALGLNSCRDQFTDEDALRLQLQQQQRARVVADSLARIRFQDSVQAATAALNARNQFALNQIALEARIQRERDSLLRVGGVVNYVVNVVYGNTATFSQGTRELSNVDGAVVTVAQNGRVVSVTTNASGLAAFPNLRVGRVTGSIIKTGFTPAKFVANITPSTPFTNAPGQTTGGVDPSGQFRSASSLVPIFELPTEALGTARPEAFAQIRGVAEVDTDLTNAGRERVPAGVRVTAIIDANDRGFRSIFQPVGGVAIPSVGGPGDGFVEDISYENAVFTTTTNANGEYSFFVPGMASASGLAYQLRFGDFAAGQTLYVTTTEENGAYTDPRVVTTRATFGPGIAASALPVVANATVSIAGPAAGGLNAAGFARLTPNSGGVTSVVLENTGSGYTQAPTVSFIGGSGSGAAATATIAEGRVSAVTVSAAGNYSAPPRAVFTNAVATEVLIAEAAGGFEIRIGSGSISETVVWNEGGVGTPLNSADFNGRGAGLTRAPGLIVPQPELPGGTAAAVTASVSNGQLALAVTNGGSGYTNGLKNLTLQFPEADVTGGVVTFDNNGRLVRDVGSTATRLIFDANSGGRPADTFAPAVLKATTTVATGIFAPENVELSSRGNGIRVAPRITVSGAGSGTGAEATPTFEAAQRNDGAAQVNGIVTRVTLTNPGSNYPNGAALQFVEGPTTLAAAGVRISQRTRFDADGVAAGDQLPFNYTGTAGSGYTEAVTVEYDLLDEDGNVLDKAVNEFTPIAYTVNMQGTPIRAASIALNDPGLGYDSIPQIQILDGTTLRPAFMIDPTGTIPGRDGVFNTGALPFNVGAVAANRTPIQAYFKTFDANNDNSVTAAEITAANTAGTNTAPVFAVTLTNTGPLNGISLVRSATSYQNKRFAIQPGEKIRATITGFGTGFGATGEVTLRTTGGVVTGIPVTNGGSFAQQPIIRVTGSNGVSGLVNIQNGTNFFRDQIGLVSLRSTPATIAVPAALAYLEVDKDGAGPLLPLRVYIGKNASNQVTTATTSGANPSFGTGFTAADVTVINTANDLAAVFAGIGGAGTIVAFDAAGTRLYPANAPGTDYNGGGPVGTADPSTNDIDLTATITGRLQGPLTVSATNLDLPFSYDVQTALVQPAFGAPTVQFNIDRVVFSNAIAGTSVPNLTGGFGYSNTSQLTANLELLDATNTVIGGLGVLDFNNPASPDYVGRPIIARQIASIAIANIGGVDFAGRNFGGNVQTAVAQPQPTEFTGIVLRAANVGMASDGLQLQNIRITAQGVFDYKADQVRFRVIPAAADAAKTANLAELPNYVIPQEANGVYRIHAINITEGGAGYTASPYVVYGTTDARIPTATNIFDVPANAATARVRRNNTTFGDGTNGTVNALAATVTAGAVTSVALNAVDFSIPAGSESGNNRSNLEGAVQIQFRTWITAPAFLNPAIIPNGVVIANSIQIDNPGRGYADGTYPVVIDVPRAGVTAATAADAYNRVIPGTINDANGAAIVGAAAPIPGGVAATGTVTVSGGRVTSATLTSPGAGYTRLPDGKFIHVDFRTFRVAPNVQLRAVAAQGITAIAGFTPSATRYTVAPNVYVWYNGALRTDVVATPVLNEVGQVVRLNVSGGAGLAGQPALTPANALFATQIPNNLRYTIHLSTGPVRANVLNASTGEFAPADATVENETIVGAGGRVEAVTITDRGGGYLQDVLVVVRPAAVGGAGTIANFPGVAAVQALRDGAGTFPGVGSLAWGIGRVTNGRVTSIELVSNGSDYTGGADNNAQVHFFNYREAAQVIAVLQGLAPGDAKFPAFRAAQAVATVANGGVNRVTVLDGGEGYPQAGGAPTVSIAQDRGGNNNIGSSGATATATMAFNDRWALGPYSVTLGQVTGVTVTAPGSGFIMGNNPATAQVFGVVNGRAISGGGQSEGTLGIDVLSGSVNVVDVYYGTGQRTNQFSN